MEHLLGVVNAELDDHERRHRMGRFKDARPSAASTSTASTGGAPDLSDLWVQNEVEWCRDQQYHHFARNDTAGLYAALRAHLRKKVSPEFIEPAFAGIVKAM